MLIVTPMAVRSIYAQLPKRLHRSLGRISAWLIALGLEAAGLAMLGIGVVLLLGLIDQRMSARVFAAISPSEMLLYLLVTVFLSVSGALAFFVGRIVSHQRNRGHSRI